MTNEPRSPKRWLIGEPLASEKLEGQLLPKHLALPIFSSDALSSVAYAPQELLLILVIGGFALTQLAPYIAAAVIVLLITVVVSYRLIIKAYPSGGGDYEVASKNLGEKAGLVVASALLVDYVMTVAVSVASGVDNIISALPFLAEFRVEIAVGFIVILAAVNLRGVSESSKAFAIPTYLFVGSIGVMIVAALVRTALGDPPVAESAAFGIHQQDALGQAGIVLLLLRAFASGCSALTGVEAISNGVQAFRRPKIQNAQKTLVAMGTIAIVLFAGLVAVAVISHVQYAEDPARQLIGFQAGAVQRSLVAQIASSVFGNNSVPFFIIQAATAAVLLLAANTAFNGFPLLGSVLATDKYAPKSLSTRGDRLIFSNGVIALAVAAAVILVVFRANVSALIQLYIIGVFVSFTLGQTGMIRHWNRQLREGTGTEKRGVIKLYRAINTFGALMTFTVLIIVTITKFTHGAYIVFIIMPILYTLMLGVNRYYRDVDKEIEADPTTRFGAKGDHAIVLVGRMQKPVLKALDYAIAARHDSIEAVHVSIDDDATDKLEKDWVDQNIKVPLNVLESPYRDISAPLAKYIKHRRETHGSEVVTVYTPQYIVGHWWENFLHNHKARRIRHKLALVHGVVIALVPWLLDSSTLIYGRRSRPLPGQARRGEPRRPVARKPMPSAKASSTTKTAAAKSNGTQVTQIKTDTAKQPAKPREPASPRK
ncbi:MAG: family permease [Rhodoglobus sp.]|nr:family permease [Rhodoglobus sp.]